MSIFHKYESCTDRKCVLHWIRNTADGFEKASQDIRELNEKYPVKPKTSIREDLYRISQKVEEINDTLGRITEGFSK